MRVLLPFPKTPGNESPKEQAQDSGTHSPESLFLAEQQALFDAVQQIPPETATNQDTTLAKLPLKDPPASALLPDTSVARPASWKTTGLQPLEAESCKRSSPASSRKRPRPVLEDTSSQHTAHLERKPAAKPNMVLNPAERRPNPSNLLYENEGTRSGRSLVTRISIDDDPALMENNPAAQTVASPVELSPEAGGLSRFALALKKRGLEIREQDGDGNCLFRAVSLQVYGDSSMHEQVRQQCLDFMERDKEHFSQFVTGEAFTDYIQRKRQNGVHGNNPEIQAISELFNRPIEVFSPDKGATPLNIFHAEYKTDDTPIRLSYHDGNHYNAVVDPLVPTAGLGLGLPGLQPGLADKMQVAKAVAESDAAADQMALQKALKESQDDELQRALKESKLSSEQMQSHEAITLSDMDATYFELEQAALEHSLVSQQQIEHGKKKQATSPRLRRDKKPARLPETTSGKLSVCSDTSATTSVASLPKSALEEVSEANIPAVASRPPAAAAAAATYASSANAKMDDTAARIRSVDDYPPVVQELVMNGFELGKVVRAVELIGQNFDDLVPFLMANTN